ncbi:MAG: DUF3568 family protein [Planctomycetota bacterium]
MPLEKLSLRFALAGSVFFTAGCGVELAVLGAAASAASSGSAVFKQGKLNASWMGEFEDVIAAGEHAVYDLGLRPTHSLGDPDKGVWKIIARDEHRDTLKIDIRRQTPRLTEFQIDVGWFGRESTARLVLKRMAVAIQLDADRDGTGEAVVPPAPLAAPPQASPAEPSETPPDSP